MLTLEDDRNNRINFDEFSKMFNKMSEHSRNYWYFFMLRDQHASERLENFKNKTFLIFLFSVFFFLCPAAAAVRLERIYLCLSDNCHQHL